MAMLGFFFRAFSTELWVGGFGRLKPLTQFKIHKCQLLPCPTESAVIVDPVQDWIKHYRIQDNSKVHKFTSHASQRRHTNQQKNKLVVEGGGNEKMRCAMYRDYFVEGEVWRMLGVNPAQDTKMRNRIPCSRQRTAENDTLSGGTSNIWE